MHFCDCSTDEAREVVQILGSRDADYAPLDSVYREAAVALALWPLANSVALEGQRGLVREFVWLTLEAKLDR